MTNDQIAQQFEIVSDFSHHHYLKAHEIVLLRSTHEDPESAKRAAHLERRRKRGHSLTYRERKARKRAQQAGYMFDAYVPRPLCSERRREIARIAAAASVEARRARQQAIGISFVGEGTPRLRS